MCVMFKSILLIYPPTLQDPYRPVHTCGTDESTRKEYKKRIRMSFEVEKRKLNEFHHQTLALNIESIRRFNQRNVRTAGIISNMCDCRGIAKCTSAKPNEIIIHIALGGISRLNVLGVAEAICFGIAKEKPERSVMASMHQSKSKSTGCAHENWK